MIYYAKYGTAWTLQGYPLVDRITGQYKSTPTLAAGDFKIEKDGGAAANLATLPTVAPAGGISVAITFSAAEMQCRQAVLRLADQAGAEWNDDCIHIFTVGDPSAYMQFDQFAATVGLSSGSQSAVVAAVWSAIRANHTAVGSFGEGVSSVRGDVTGNVTGNVGGSVGGNVEGSVLGTVGGVAAGGISSLSLATDALSASALSQAATQKIADEILNRNLAGGGSGNSRNIRNALRGLRNRVKNQGGTLSIYEEDDTTIAWTAATTTAAGDPMTELDPT
jgi:hypothetical protein